MQRPAADVAQLVEHFTRNEGVRGSNPRVGFEEEARTRGPPLFSWPSFPGTQRQGGTPGTDPGQTQGSQRADEKRAGGGAGTLS
jgi:hypothetical protein